jgi:hypothetical protein
MQKSGEKYLQSRPAIAVMIKEGYLSPKGELTDKYKDASDKEKAQLVDKIQRVNQMIHGRYTQQEAATLQQSVLYRLISQFKNGYLQLLKIELVKENMIIDYKQKLKEDMLQ